MGWDHWDNYYYFECPNCGKKVNIIEHVREHDMWVTDRDYWYIYEKCSCGFDFEKEMNEYFNNMSKEEYEHHKYNSSMNNYHRGTTTEEYKQIIFCKYKNIKIESER